MAHTVLKPTEIVNLGLGLLTNELLLARLITRKSGADFVGKYQDTVTVRLPALATAREYDWRNDRANPIETDDLDQVSIPVTLNKHPYHAADLTDEQMTLDFTEFGREVLEPQALAVATKIDGYVASAMAGAPHAETIVVDSNDDFHDDVLVEARRHLNVANVPVSNRVIVLGSNVEAWALRNDLFKRADQSGSDSVLRESIIGRGSGFTVVGNVNTIDPNKAYAFHPTAFILAQMAPIIPKGATYGATGTYEGFALRWLQDYDSDHLQDRSVVSAFAGTASVNDERDGSGALTNQNCRCVEIDFEGPS